MPINPERAGSWTPPHFLGKKYFLSFEAFTNDEPYRPSTAADAIATVRDSGMFEDLDGYSGQQEMIEDEARKQFPDCFGLETSALPEQKVTSIAEAAARRQQLRAVTHYVVPHEVLDNVTGNEKG